MRSINQSVKVSVSLATVAKSIFIPLKKIKSKEINKVSHYQVTIILLQTEILLTRYGIKTYFGSNSHKNSGLAELT